MSHMLDVQEQLTLLDQERSALLAAVNEVSPELRGRRPSAGTWSVAEVLEHLAVVERGVAKLIAVRGQEQPVSQPSPLPLDATRIARLRNRAQPIDAPERVRPTGALSADDALRLLEASRLRLREALLAADPAALDGCTHAHVVLGVMTLRDWTRFVAHHEARHAAQISAIGRALA